MLNWDDPLAKFNEPEAKAQAANFPFCTIEPNVGMVEVPDPRLSNLVVIVHSKKMIRYLLIYFFFFFPVGTGSMTSNSFLRLFHEG